MVKKASLDILEIEPLEPVNIPALAQEHEAPESALELSSEPVALKKKQPLKVWIVTGLIMAVVLTSSVVFWFAARDLGHILEPEKEQTQPELQVSREIADLSRFYVDLKDDQGRIRILACDVMLALSGRQNPGRLAARPDVRTAIYLAVQGSTYERLVDPMGFQYLKSNILSALNRLLGPGVVSEVYLTEFLLM